MRLATASTKTSTTPTTGLEGRNLLEAGVRDRAEAVLQSLLTAKAECEKTLTKLRRTDAMKSVTGKSSLDRAISSTKQIIRELDETKSDAALRCSEVEVRVTAPAAGWRREPQVAGIGHGR